MTKMIHTILLSMLLKKKKVVDRLLERNPNIWLELEKIGLGASVEQFLSENWTTNRTLTELRTNLGHKSDMYLNVIIAFKEMRSTQKKYVRITISIPPDLDDTLKEFKADKGMKSQFLVACADSVLKTIDNDTQKMHDYVNTWLSTQKIVIPEIPKEMIDLQEQSRRIEERNKKAEDNRQKRQVHNETLNLREVWSKEVSKVFQVLLRERKDIKRIEGGEITKDEYEHLREKAQASVPKSQELLDYEKRLKEQKDEREAKRKKSTTTVKSKRPTTRAELKVYMEAQHRKNEELEAEKKKKKSESIYEEDEDGLF